MNSKQKQKIRARIKKGAAAIKCYYLRGDQTCIIGDLLIQAGVSKEVFKGPKNSEGIQSCPEFLKVLHDYYGLDEEEADELQRANDRIDSDMSRTNELLETLDKLEVAEL